MRRSALFVTVLATLAIGLVGCSSETPGEASPGDNGGETIDPTGGGSVPPFPEDSTSSEEPSDPGGGGGTDDLQPCELLSAQDLGALGLPPDGAEEDLASARTCQWQASGSHTVTTGVLDNVGLDDVVSSGDKQPKTVGSHDAVQYTVGTGTCAVALGVTDTSRVDVSAGAGGDMTKACDVANQAAELIEQKLP